MPGDNSHRSVLVFDNTKFAFAIENLNLEELAAAEAHEFVFVCLPLKMRGATGSPLRPIALVPRQPGS